MIDFEENFEYLTEENVKGHLENFHWYVNELMTRSAMGVSLDDDQLMAKACIIRELFVYQQMLIKGDS